MHFIKTPMRATGDAYHEARRLKWPLIMSQILTDLGFAVVLAPVLSLALALALKLSGQPALADQDIAHFLFSPMGALAGVAVGCLFVTSQVLGTSLMMTIIGLSREGRPAGVRIALERVLRRLPAILVFAAGLIVRILLIALPFLAVAAGLAWALISEFDINFYLTERPPSFILAAIGIALVLLAMAAVLIPRLLSWSLGLPLILAGQSNGRSAFADSRDATHGVRPQLLQRLIFWAVVAVAISLAIGVINYALARTSVATAGASLETMASLLLACLGIAWLLGLLRGALVGGALSTLLMEAADWPAIPVRDGPPLLPRLTVPILIGVLLLALFTGGVGMGLPANKTDQQIEIIAHRGGAIAKPENTLAALEQGAVEQADWLEIDVQESADDAVIVFHDSDFMKVASNPMKVWDATLEDLAQIDIGGWFDPGYRDQRVPVLEEVLSLARDRSKVLIELKYYGHDRQLEQRVADIVAAEGMDAQVAAMSLKYEGVRKMKALRPDWQVGLLAATAVGRLWELEADFLAVNIGLATPRFIGKAQEAGKPVHVWTVNDPISIARAASLGVDGVITDAPGLARTVIEDWRSLSTVERFVLALGDTLGLSGFNSFGSAGDA